VLGVIHDQGVRDHPSRLDGGTRWSGIRCVDAECTSDSWRSGAGLSRTSPRRTSMDYEP
jgi:hypothetical protein